MKALLVIDMQQGSFTEQTPRYDTEGVTARINMLGNYVRKNNGAVIFIQHDGSKENEFLPGTSDWQLLPLLTKHDADILVSKTANDCFYNSNLYETLQALHVDEVIITGCATDFCVDTTIRSALAKDYNVTVISDGHTTANRQHLPAEKVIEHHNWVWQNMLPTKGRIAVKTAEEFMTKFVTDSFDELTDDDKEELTALINEPVEKDTMTHEEFHKATEKWRTG